MYSGSGGPSDEELAALGLKREDLAGPEDRIVWVYQENWAAFVLFSRLQTQWRMGMAGATGLDYAGMEAAMRIIGTRDRAKMFDDISIMERAALSAMAEKRK
ncbi:MAG: DUF1799 domain-containing protein [Sulfuricella denitrificans]|nr:DUF1799 domain-containing protein [Sulfuricella denitrificans]